tara:strand:- start:19086 stop:20684 length:1599 start_codon:yes stop_codon:yes gene_type:complete
MKLKALKPRLFNVMFHTHTVSGIVISFALFVIFYAGAFSLFRHELYQWENPLSRFETKKNIDYEATIKFIENNTKQGNAFRNINIVTPSDANPFIKFFSSYKDSLGKNKNISYYINPHTYEVYKEPNKFSNPKALTYLADTLYRLHYFRQIPFIGRYLSGLVAFFFLFAIVTGILLHWKQIANKFYNLNVKGKWKQIWTNSHTVIGTITIPFQFIFALTGAFLCLNIFLLAPSAYILFDGDTNEIIKLIDANAGKKYDKNAKDIKSTKTINQLYSDITEEYPNHHINRIRISNFGKEDGAISFQIDDERGLLSNGNFMYRYKDGSLIDETIPNKKSYVKATLGIITKLHFGNFGGYLLRIIYFILALLTCYVITSGVMIWQTARNNSKYTDKQKRFHHRVTKFYLAFTSSLFPAVALIFIANKVIPMAMEFRVVYVKNTFFIGWLLFTLLGLFWNNYSKLNRNYLIIGSVLSLSIPIVNGIVTSDWLWKTLANNQYYVFSVDFTWFLTGVFGLWIFRNLRKKQSNKKVTRLT